MSDPTPQHPAPDDRIAPYIIIQQLGVEKDVELVFSSLDKWAKACETLTAYLKDHNELFELTLER